MRKHFDMVATTHPMGAGKWKVYYNEYLKGKNVYIIPDNDTDQNSPSYKKGMNHAMDVANQLLGTAKSVKIVELPQEFNGLALPCCRMRLSRFVVMPVYK